ncbi:hypothetical protein EGR_01659 [Echinococcus granulosus]|uniref:X prolyl aminopeptidase n=1 Tax=Echinococcus granulosus TaxID=6210 RepID=U6J3D9_ECHGR|nr:hypothetical protein EGR_01659 [Echinococcus granulosus]EUB63577.1 hypothetical protein EGR_01659 [Echinococcus granulosus]CDS16220.1 X prolyl aminopeptidase [Echinococcus granulosus]
MDEEELFQPLRELFDEEQTTRTGKTQISFDMWGSCTPRNICKKIRRTACLKPFHRELLRQFLGICVGAGVEVFVYGGTALGVFREGGQMIAFDYDTDFATLEYPQGSELSSEGNLSRLANFCLRERSGVRVVNVEGPQYELPLDATIQVDFQNSFSSTLWLFTNSKGSVCERSYTGSGSKRAKFYFTSRGLREAAQRVGRVKSSVVEELNNDLTDIHVDLFTLSPHPDSPQHHLRVNWHKGGVYDSMNKKFSWNLFFPLKKVTFEGLEVLAPSNLKGYLTEEYGYLGRDAMYDSVRQRYIKIPEHLRDALPHYCRKYILESPFEMQFS